jgi:hypothetical protein
MVFELLHHLKINSLSLWVRYKYANTQIHKYCAGILEQSMGARNREGIGLLYRTVGIHTLASIL